MTKKLWLLMVPLFWFPIAVGAASSPGAEDFYKGKTIRFIVGFTAGGGFDVYARTIARHINKHIPGKPTTIVDNMPGAGSLIAANYIFN
jgi:tripartite-type tricarboxylate transporter receptor subunit TctC